MNPAVLLAIFGLGYYLLPSKRVKSLSDESSYLESLKERGIAAVHASNSDEYWRVIDTLEHFLWSPQLVAKATAYRKWLGNMWDAA